MTRVLRSFFALLLFTILALQAHATHLLGGELYYEYQSTAGTIHTYKVTLRLFADCASSSGGAFTLLPTASPVINLYNDATFVTTQTLQINAALSDVEITPVCPDEAGNTTCSNSSNPIPGVKLYVYEGTIQLNGESANWRFAFEGGLTNSSAGRSTIITNANVAGGGSLMCLVATLNNTAAVGQNNSPVFTSLPTPFFCVDKIQNYNLGATDADDDLMTFSLTDALEDANPVDYITYINPYTAIAPLPTAAGDFAFNATNGQMTFTPNIAMNCVVVNSVNEYRNGVLVGTSQREMTFVILDNCYNDAPDGPIVNTENVDIVDVNGQEMFQVCAGQSATVSYDINAADPNGDNITVTWTGLPAGSAVVVDGNGTPNPVVHFLWNVTNAVEGNYTFYITYTDDGCPLSTAQTLAYTLQVIPFAEQFTDDFISPCLDQENGMVWIQPQDNTGILYDYYWYDNDMNLLATTMDVPDGDTLQNVGVGVYSVRIVNPDGCRKTYNVVIEPDTYSVHINMEAADTLVCTNTGVILSVQNSPNITSWTWDFGDGTPTITDQAIVNHFFTEEGTFTVTAVGQTDLQCTASDTVQVKVDAPQAITLFTPKDSLCVGEKLDFMSSVGKYADSLYWNFGASNVTTIVPDTVVGYVYDEPGVYTVALNVAYRECPDLSAQHTVTIFPYPTVNLGNDTSLCLDGAPIFLANRVAQPSSYTGIWSTGDSTATLKVIHPGKYSLTVASDFNCKTTDEIEIKKDCYLDVPNTFTPNSDGINDYFFPRQLMSAKVTGFKMSVFNRWGQVVFETESMDGRGWDGRLNGQDQPVGVYIYQIKAIIDGSKTENYEGNVSLIR